MLYGGDFELHLVSRGVLIVILAIYVTFLLVILS